MRNQVATPNQGLWRRWLPLAVIAAVPLLFSTLGTNNGCGNHNTLLLGQPCTQNDDCAGQSVCTYAKTCHDWCAKDSDCPGTQQCVNAGSSKLQEYCACTPAEAPSCSDGCPAGTFCHPDYLACVQRNQDAGACSIFDSVDGGDCLDPNWQACRPAGTCSPDGAYSDGGPGGYCPSTGGTTSGGTTTGGSTTGGSTTGGSTTGGTTTGGATTGGSTSGGTTTGGSTTGGATTGGSTSGGTTGGGCWPPGHDCPAGPTPLCCSGVCLPNAMCQ